MNIDDTNAEQPQESNFAAFEAEAKGDATPAAEPEKKPEEPLELGTDETPEATPEEVEADK